MDKLGIYLIKGYRILFLINIDQLSGDGLAIVRSPWNTEQGSIMSLTLFRKVLPINKCGWHDGWHRGWYKTHFFRFHFKILY